MNITIIGTGNGASALAADLSIKKHNITMLKSSNSKLHNDHFNFLKKNKGKIFLNENNQLTETRLKNITEDYSEAITDNTDLVIIFIQTNYHKEVINKILPYLKKNQTVLIEPGYLSTLYFYENDRYDLNIIEAESSPIDCRINIPGQVDVLFRNVRNPIAIETQNNENDVLKKIEGLGYNFQLMDSIVEAALHNPNIIVHTIGAIMSIPRIEYTKGDYWMYKEVFTPSVWKIVEKLDKEKMSILKSLGLRDTCYVDKCLFRNSENLSLDAKEVFFDYAFNNSPKGPHESDSRYITEDVSQGLVLIEDMGKYLGILTPVATSLIDLSSVALATDFRKSGRKFENGLLESYLETYQR